MALHWTQTAKGKKKWAAIRTKGLSARGRKRISAAVKARHAREKAAKEAALNGHATVTEPVGMPVMAGNHRGLAKAYLQTLAIEGAKQRLKEVERERETLLMFIQGQLHKGTKAQIKMLQRDPQLHAELTLQALTGSK